MLILAVLWKVAGCDVRAGRKRESGIMGSVPHSATDSLSDLGIHSAALPQFNNLQNECRDTYCIGEFGSFCKVP